MPSLPVITETTIRGRATPQSWERGVEYFYEGRVSQVVWRDGTLTARVEGSQYEPYLVQVTFDPGGAILSADCNCPYDWGGDCKHIIATLLYLLHRPQEIEVRPALADLLSDLSHERLLELLLHLAEIHPEIVDTVEELVTAPVTPTSPVVTQPPVDLAVLQRQIKADLRASCREYYDDYWDGDYVEFGAALEPALKCVETLLAADDARGALAVLEAATLAWIDGIRTLDEDMVDYIYGDERLADLGRSWAQALLQADLTAQERAHWSKTLSNWARTMPGGEALDIAVTAAGHGWDYPPLVAAMQGHITEDGAWEGEVPEFADDLALIRLSILERRGRFEEYLNLAQAEGQFLLYLQMLIRLGRSDTALKEALEFLIEPQEVHVVARALVEHGDVEQGLELAAYGLSLESSSGKGELAVWLRDEAYSRGRTELALDAAWKALESDVTFASYLWLAEHAEQWPKLRPQALKLVESSQHLTEVMNIYLYEHMYCQAMELVERKPWFGDLRKVIDAVKGEYPDWAFRKCREQAEQIIDAGKADQYSIAVDWLQRGRDILLAAGRGAEWEAYLRQLLSTHRRKYRLVPMLERLSSRV